MAESSTLRIEIEPTTTAQAASSSLPEKLYTQSKPRNIGDDDPVKREYREAIRKQQNEKETQDRINAKEIAQRKRDDEQARNEDWLERQEMREQKKRDREQQKNEDWIERQEARLRSQQERQQKKDEDWLERQEMRDQKTRERQQKKDEDYYEREQLRERQRREMSDPANIARRVYDWRMNNANIQGQLQVRQFASSFGLNQNSQLVSQTAQLAGGFSTLLARVNPLIFSVGVLNGLFNASQRHFREEAQRVERFSPQLRMQEIVNRFREIQTDIEIAQRFGDRMAKADDRASRWERVERLAKTSFDAMLEDMFGWFDEIKLSIAEWTTSSGDYSKQSLKAIQALYSITDKQAKEMGLDKHAAALASGIQIAAQAFATIGEDLYDATTFEKMAKDLDIQPAAGRDQPDFPIVRTPDWWMNREF